MRLFMWTNGFKIKSKNDAERLLNATDSADFGHAESDVYWCDDKYDYCLYTADKEVGFRLKSERGNIFSAYLIVTDPVETIWKTRKYINSQIFSRE